MPFKTMSAPVKLIKPVVKPVLVKPPVKPPMVSPPSPPAPVWTRIDLPVDCTQFDVNQFVAHGGVIISVYAHNGLMAFTYGLGLFNIIPPVGTWQEQVSNDLSNLANYQNTAIKIIQLQAGSNNTTSVNLTLDGSVGPAKLMRYLKL